jgi:hypothetical protein
VSAKGVCPPVIGGKGLQLDGGGCGGSGGDGSVERANDLARGFNPNPVCEREGFQDLLRSRRTFFSLVERGGARGDGVGVGDGI